MRFNFKKDIEEGSKQYPSLHLDYKDKKPVVKGTFTAHKSTIQVEDYEVLISFPPNYPYGLPLVVETSNKILPRNAARHIFTNDTLCFGNHQDILRVCKGGITFLWFLTNILNPHLCREYVREITGEYLTGERGHGTNGTWEGYYDILKTTDKVTVLKELRQMLTNSSFSKNRYCYCGSGKKYKRCHENLETLVFDIGKHNVRKLYNQLKEDFEKKVT